MTSGTCARIWLLVPVLLATGCATSVQRAQEERGSMAAYNTDPGGEFSAVANKFVPSGEFSAVANKSVREFDRHPGPNPGGKLARGCGKVSFEFLRLGHQSNDRAGLLAGLFLAASTAAVCLPIAAVVGIAHEIAPPSAGVGYGYDKPELRKLTDEEKSVFPGASQSAGIGGGSDRKELRKLTDDERSVFPSAIQSASKGDGYDRPVLRKLTSQEASVFPTSYFDSCHGFRC